MQGKSNMETYITILKQIDSGNLLYDTESQPMLCDSLEG